MENWFEMTVREAMTLILGNYMKYGMRDTWRSLSRHKGMVFVSVLTVAVTLIVLGATLLLAFNSQYMTNNVEEQLEIIAFLKADVSREDALELEKTIRAMPGYKQATFVPKEDALTLMGDKFGGETILTDALGGVNPLPDAYNIKVDSPEQIQGVVDRLEKVDDVEMVRYGKDVVDNVMILSEAIYIACIVVIVAMCIAALFLVNSTIRLTVFARSEEIAIMKYVGATNFYVHIPFFLEGLFIGVFGALLANVAIYFGYNAVVEYLQTYVTFIPVLNDPQLLFELMAGLLIGGTLLGALGSNFAVKKYLKV